MHTLLVVAIASTLVVGLDTTAFAEAAQQPSHPASFGDGSALQRNHPEKNTRVDETIVTVPIPVPRLQQIDAVGTVRTDSKN